MASAWLAFLSFLTSAITVTWGNIAFEAADKTAIENAVWGWISSFWSAIMMVLPYVAIFAVLGLVVGIILGMLKFKR